MTYAELLRVPKPVLVPADVIADMLAGMAPGPMRRDGIVLVQDDGRGGLVYEYHDAEEA